MSKPFVESAFEGAAPEWLEALGYVVVAGLSIAPGAPAGEGAMEDVA